jgi:outer membrane protein assembly factor BamB
VLPRLVRVAAVIGAATLAVSGCAEHGERPAASGTPSASSLTAKLRTAPRAQVRVLDGDTGTPVAGAMLSTLGRSWRTNFRGVAQLPLPGTPYFALRVSASGYLPARPSFERAPTRRYTVVLYRRDLQWPFYGAGPERRQAQATIGLRPPFRIVWSRGLGGLLEFPAVVWKGNAYVTTDSGYLYSLSMSDGRTRWMRRIGWLVASSAAVDPDGRLLAVTTMDPGNLQVLDRLTGRTLWTYPTGTAEPSPVIVDHTAYVGATAGGVYALDIARERLRWRFDDGAKTTASPTLVGHRLYIGNYAGRVVALDARSGRLLWSGYGGRHIYGTIAFADGRLFVPSVETGLTALSARTGAELWHLPAAGYLYSAPAVAGDRVYFGDYAGRLTCADAATGRVLWTAWLPGPISGAVEVVAGVVYAGSFADRIEGFDALTGKRLLEFGEGQYAPVSGNGSRLLLHGYSRIFAVEPRRPPGREVAASPGRRRHV